MGKIKLFYHILRNMGLSYMLHRSTYELKRKSGLLKKKFPTDVPLLSYISLEEWRNRAAPFFFHSREHIQLERKKNNALKEKVAELKNGVFTFFSSTKFNLGDDFDWVTNLNTNYQYNSNQYMI